MKRFIRILALGLLCGIGLTAARSMLHLSRGVVWVALTVLFLGIFAVNYLYIRHYNNKIRAILPLLEQNQTRAFITALEDLEGGTLNIRIEGGSVDIPLDNLVPAE